MCNTFRHATCTNHHVQANLKHSPWHSVEEQSSGSTSLIIGKFNEPCLKA